MRTAYHEHLSDLTKQLAQACGLAGAAMGRATQALLDSDLAAAEAVVTDHERIVALSAHAEESAFSLLALQQPVAGELRTIVSALQVAADVDRMGALALHVAKITQARHPQHVLPADVRACFAEMGRLAVGLATHAQEVLLAPNADMAARLREEDDAMDDIHTQLLTVLMDREWKYGVPAAVDIVLLGRFYERFADHAVEVGRRVVFQVTGALPPEQIVSTY